MALCDMRGHKAGLPSLSQPSGSELIHSSGYWLEKLLLKEACKALDTNANVSVNVFYFSRGAQDQAIGRESWG